MVQRESFSSTYVRTYRTYIFGTTENTVALLTRETRTRVPYTWATSPQTPRMELLRFFSKVTNLPLCVLVDKFQRDSRRYPGNRHFSSRARSSRATTSHIRVTTVSCLELVLQSAPISHRRLPRDVISCRVVSGS